MRRKAIVKSALAWLLAFSMAIPNTALSAYAAESISGTYLETETQETDTDEEEQGEESGSKEAGEENGEGEETGTGEESGEGEGTEAGEESGEGEGTEAGEENGEGEETGAGKESGEGEETGAGKESGEGEETGAGKETGKGEETESGDSEDEQEKDGSEASENSVSDNSVSENTLEAGEMVTKVMAQDSLGRLLSQDIEIDDSQTQTEDYGVCRVEITGQSAVVTYRAPDDADLVVAIYEESSGKMAASGNAEVEAHGLTATVTLYGGTLPQYYIVKAYLTDPISKRPLCQEYEDKDHTKVMQEFYAKKESDFDPERVYSMDESEDNNFAVFAEDVLIIREGEEENKCTSADEENAVYQFENAEEKLQEAEPGQIIAYFYQDEEKTPIIAKIYQIQIKDSDVTITGTDMSVEEVFSFLKISAGYEEAEGEEEDEEEYSVNAEDSGLKIKKLTKNEIEMEYPGIKGKYKYVPDANWRYDEDGVDLYADMTVDIHAEITVSVKAEGEIRFPDPEIHKTFYDECKLEIPLTTVLNVTIRPALVLKLEGKVSGTLSFDKKIGVSVTHADDKWTPVNLSEDLDIGCTIGEEVSIFSGVNITASLVLIDERIASLGIEGEVGPKLTLSARGEGTNYGAREHECSQCYSGSVSLHVAIKFSLKLADEEKLPEDVQDALSWEHDFPAGECYYSSDAYPNFDWGECPNIRYHIEVVVKDQNGAPVSGAKVYRDTDYQITDDNGKTSLALTKRPLQISAEKDGETGTKKYDGKEKQVFITLKRQAEEIQVKQVELASHQAIITGDNTLYMWGDNDYGQVGNGTTNVQDTPVKVRGLENEKIKQVQISDGLSAAITFNGELYTWGRNDYGQLGQGDKYKTSSYIAVPKRVEGVGQVKSVTVGSNVIAAITEDGELYMWGNNEYGQVGNEDAGNICYSPLKVSMGDGVSVKQIAMGDKHCIALDKNGKVYTWGNNFDGQLGDGTNTEKQVPQTVDVGDGKKVEQVYAASPKDSSSRLTGGNSAALTTDGCLYIWGDNNESQIGDGTTGTDRNVSVKVEFPASGRKVTQFHISGDGRCIALLNDGTVWTWGGDDIYAPCKVAGLSDITEIYGSDRKDVDFSSYREFYGAKDKYRNLYTWGSSTYVGHDESETPKIILTHVKDVQCMRYAGYYYNNDYYAAAVIAWDGTLYTWGNSGHYLQKDNALHTAPFRYEGILPAVNAGYQADAAEESVEESVEVSAEGTAQYDGLAAGETYNFYVMKDRDKEDSLFYDNLLYIAQGQADADGCLSFRYVMREACASADVFIVAKGQKDLSEASVELENLIHTGNELYPDPVVKDQERTLKLGEDYELDGDYIVKEIGSYQLTIRGIGQYKGEISKEFKVTEAADPEEPDDPEDHGDVLDEDMPEDGVIPDGLWIPEIAEQTYTGKQIKPAVRVYDGKKLLTEKKDYTVAYKNNTNANDAKNEKKAPTITITGKGNYTGKDTQTFVIARKKISDEDIMIEPPLVTYNGKVQKPVPTVTWNGKKLTQNKDYTLSYPSEGLNSYKEAGEYEIKITGKGNFALDKTVSFTITEAKLISKCKVTGVKNQSYTGAELCPEPIVKDGSQTLEKDVHYTVSYENNKEIGTATVVISGKGSYTGEKRVTFQIKPEVSFSKVKVALKAADGTAYKGGAYTGEEVKPDSYELSVTVKDAQKNTQTIVLKENEHYTVSYQNNVEKGKATILFTGIGAFQGTLKQTYTITAYDMTADWNRKPQDRKLTAELEESYPYRKGGSRPEPTVKFDGVLLTKGKDYTLSYQNNGAVNDGSGQKKPTVIISGKGNFKGKISASYRISQADISCLTMNAADKSSKEKANIYKTKVEIFDTDGKKLAAGKDYDKTFTYTYEEDTELKDGTVRKAGDSVEKTDVIPHKTVLRVTAYAKSGGSYSGELSATYRILSQNRDISKAKVTIPAQFYNGQQITPADQITVKLGGQKLKEGVEYEIAGYENNVNKGTATVTLRGIGECGGTKTAKFKIKGKGFLWWWRS